MSMHSDLQDAMAEELAALRAQLAAVEDRLSSANNSVAILETRVAAVERERDTKDRLLRESRDYGRGMKQDWDRAMDHLTDARLARDAALAREAALEADLARERDQAQSGARLLLAEQERRAKQEVVLAIDRLRAFRALAGLTKEGK